MKALKIKQERGVALIIAMIIMTLLALLTIGSLNLLTTNIQITYNYIRDLRAMYIADSGVEDAIDRLRDDINRDGENWTTNFPDPSDDYSKYDVSIDKPNAADPLLVISSTGTVGTLNCSLVVSVRVAGSSAPYDVVVKNWEQEG